MSQMVFVTYVITILPWRISGFLLRFL